MKRRELLVSSAGLMAAFDASVRAEATKTNKELDSDSSWLRKSIGDNLLPKSVTLEPGLHMVKQAGYDGIELWLGDREWFQVTSADKDIQQLRRKIENAGLVVSDVANVLDWDHNISSADPHIREMALHHVRRQIETAQILGTDAILVVAGLVTETDSYQDVYPRTLEALQSLSEHAAKAKVKIGCENCCAEQKFLLSPREFKLFLDDVNSPWVGLHLDVGNIHDTGFPEQWIQMNAPRITRIHVKDVLRHRGRCGNQSVYTNIFLGDNNWGAIRKALIDAKYSGWLIAEMEAHYRFAPDQQFIDTAAALDRLISGRL